MSSPDSPEDSSSNQNESASNKSRDRSLRQWQEQLESQVPAPPAKQSRAQSRSEESQPEAVAAGEVEHGGRAGRFSERSGIQDPLIKAEPQPDEQEEAPKDAEAKPGKSPHATPPGDVPDKKRKRGKRKAKLAKSQRQLERARRRQMNYLQQRRQKKKLKVFYGRIRVIFKLCFAIVWGILFWEMLHSPLWVLKTPRYQVENARLLEAAQLKPVVSDWVGKPLYAVDTGKLAKAIENRYAIVEHAVVRRQIFPARLTVQVYEKQPWAELYTTDPHPRKPAKPENTGASGKASAPKPILPYGLVAGKDMLSLAGYHYRPALYPNAQKLIISPHTTLKTSYLEKLRKISWQASQVKGMTLESVDVRDPNRVILNYREIPVILGKLNNSASDRLVRLLPLLPKIREYRDVIEAVDLKWEEQVTFHKKPNAVLKNPEPEQVQG